VVFLENYVLSPVNMTSVKEVAYVSTFPPKKRGIATFTSDLVNSIGELGKLKAQRVFSIDGGRLSTPEDESSRYNIGRDFIEDYVLMADFVNNSSVNVVNIQHEFGIYGGESGEYICAFLDKLKRPVATTIHTVLPNFVKDFPCFILRVVERSTNLIVLNETTRALVKQYGVSAKKVKVIPHGCPDLPMVSSDRVKPGLGLKN
jgi:hypothetical protein